MTQIARAISQGVDTSTAMFAPQVPDGLAGEEIDAHSPCYIAADGRVYMSNGTAAGAAAGFIGFSATSSPPGQAVTLLGLGTRIFYGSGLTPGKAFYVDTVAGRLNDAPTTGGTYVVALAVSATDIIVASAPR